MQGFTVEDPAPKPKGVWVTEGMQVKHNYAGHISTVRPMRSSTPPGYIHLFHSDGSPALGAIREYTYKNQPVLGYEEDAK